MFPLIVENVDPEAYKLAAPKPLFIASRIMLPCSVLSVEPSHTSILESGELSPFF
jgi:hypothetical protein